MIIIISNVKRAMDDSSTGAEETETMGYPARRRPRSKRGAANAALAYEQDFHSYDVDPRECRGLVQMNGAEFQAQSAVGQIPYGEQGHRQEARRTSGGDP
jgi:hypothetical protein